MSKLTDFFWPWLDRPTSQERQEIQTEIDSDLNSIRGATWLPHPELALQEARRLTDLEEDRRRTTEGKATTYILFIGALLPLLTYLESAVWEGKVGTAPKWLSVLLLAIAVLYLIGAVTWAFRTVRVSVFEQLDIPDLLKVWEDRHPDIELIKTILSAVRKNREAINKKVSCIIMTQNFLWRAFFFFALLLLTEAAWEIDKTITTQRPSIGAVEQRSEQRKLPPNSTARCWSPYPGQLKC